MNIEEARAALEAEQGECWHERSGAEGRNHVMTKADAYGAARELKGHVDACTAATGFPDLDKVRSCGLGGWLCDKAKEIEEAR